MRELHVAGLVRDGSDPTAALGVAPMSTHIGAQPGEIAPLVLMPGDPLRAKWIAETFLDDAQCYTEVRGMYGFTGTWRGHRGLGAGLRAWASRRWRSTSTSCSASTTCSRSSGSARAAR